MSLNLEIPNWDKWSKQIEELKKKLSLDHIKHYENPSLAIIDTLTSLIQTYPHKTRAVLINDGSLYFNLVLKTLNALNLDTLVLDKIPQNSEGVSAITKTDLFVFYCEDHQITGEIYHFQFLKEFLTNQKIFSIQLSHQSWRTPKKSPQQQPVALMEHRVCLGKNNKAWVLGGLRTQVNSFLGSSQNLSENLVDEICADFNTPLEEQKELIVQFEIARPQLWRPFVDLTRERVWNQAVIYLVENIHGDLLKKVLLDKKIILPHEIHSLSLCEWNYRPEFLNYFKSSFEKEVDFSFSKLILVDLQVFLREKEAARDLLSVFEESIAEVKALQNV
jgi:hypothetical protein